MGLAILPAGPTLVELGFNSQSTGTAGIDSPSRLPEGTESGKDLHRNMPHAAAHGEAPPWQAKPTNAGPQS